MIEGRELAEFVVKLRQKMKSISVFLWASFAVGAMLSVMAQAHSENQSWATTTVVTVWRRQSNDLYSILQQNKTEDIHYHGNETYLVKETQCINNHHLFNGNLRCNYRLLINYSL